MSFPETGQQRRARMLDNSSKRGYLNKRPHNNRTGQPLLLHKQNQRAVHHFNRVERLKRRGGIPLCRETPIDIERRKRAEKKSLGRA